MLNVAVDVGDNVFLRHRRLLDQNQGSRPVGGRDQLACSPHQRPAEEKRRQKLPPSPPDDALDLDKIDKLGCFLQLFVHVQTRMTTFLKVLPTGTTALQRNGSGSHRAS